MKHLLAIALFALSTRALAIDVTVSVTAPQATRIAAALGELRGLKDGAGAPRSATMAEVKQSVADHLRGIVMQVERPKAEKAAIDAVTVAPMDPQ